MSSRPVRGVVHGDLATGDGLRAALSGVQGVVHAASAPRGDVQQVDVVGTRRLVDGADRGVLRHLVYVSIVGVDRNPYRYYRAKLEAEQIVLAGDLPATVVRATQFHEFVDDLLRLARCGPLLPVPAGWASSPVRTSSTASPWRGRGQARSVAGRGSCPYRSRAGSAGPSGQAAPSRTVAASGAP